MKKECAETSWGFRKHERAYEHEYGADPVPESERVLKVDDGENETGELAESEHESDCERGALGGEHKHGAYAHVLRERVQYEVEPDERHWDDHEVYQWFRFVKELDVMDQIFVQEHKHRQGEDMLQSKY